MTASVNVPAPERRDARTIGLVGLAHGSSHFFHLLLPPLFPWLIADFDTSYSQLGVMVSLFFIVSGTGQMLSGFLVDKVGAQRVMFAALSSFVVAGLVAAVAQNYAMLLAASFFAGLGNAPFHPVDFTILNKRVTAKNIGHAFSVHGISGNIGWATAPVFMLGITTATGSWRMACACGALFAALVLVTMWCNRRWLDDKAFDSAAAPQSPGGSRCGRCQPVRLSEAACRVDVLCLLFLQHRGLERHSELRQHGPAPDVWLAADADGPGRHRFYVVRCRGHGGRWLFGAARAAAGENHCHLLAAGGGVPGAGGHGLAARHGGAGGGFGRQVLATGWPALRATC